MRNDVVYAERFVWNRRKANENLKKHQLSFETAVRIFNDPVLYMEYDTTHSAQGEDRYLCIGIADHAYTALTVIMTEQEPYIRMISARKATQKEVLIYEKNAKNLRNN